MYFCFFFSIGIYFGFFLQQRFSCLFAATSSKRPSDLCDHPSLLSAAEWRGRMIYSGTKFTVEQLKRRYWGCRRGEGGSGAGVRCLKCLSYLGFATKLNLTYPIERWLRKLTFLCIKIAPSPLPFHHFYFPWKIKYKKCLCKYQYTRCHKKYYNGSATENINPYVFCGTCL